MEVAQSFFIGKYVDRSCIFLANKIITDIYIPNLSSPKRHFEHDLSRRRYFDICIMHLVNVSSYKTIVPGLLIFKDYIPDNTVEKTIVNVLNKNKSIKEFGYIIKNETLEKTKIIDDILLKWAPYNIDQVTVEKKHNFNNNKESSELFGDYIVILVLEDDVTFTFKNQEVTHEFIVKPRTLLFLSGDSRYKWSFSTKKNKSSIIVIFRKTRMSYPKPLRYINLLTPP